MATILSTTATVNSPDVKYVVDATTSNRTENGITVKITVTANLTDSDSVLGTGSTYGIIGYIKLLGTEYSITIKGTSTKWSGTTKYTASITKTLSGLSATDTSITGITFRTTRTGDKNDGSIAHAGELGSTKCSNITFEAAIVEGKKVKIKVDGQYKDGEVYIKKNNVWVKDNLTLYLKTDNAWKEV